MTIDSGDDNDKLLNIGEKVSLNGGAGHDEILVFDSSVTIDAGIGNDTINLESAVENILVQYTAGDVNDSIKGFNATSTLSISGGEYSIHALNSDIIVTVDDGSIKLKDAASLASFNINNEAKTVEDVYYALTLPDGVTANVANAADKFEFDDKTYYKGGAELTFNAPEGSYFKDEDNKLVSTDNYTMPAADTTLTAIDLNLFTPTIITGLNFVVDSEGNGYYEISNADELNALATYTNDGNNCSGLTFKVTADIDLKDIANFTPIGNSSSNKFSGTFDGAGKTISNLTVNVDGDYAGLFGYVYSGAIKNVNLINVDITGNNYVGGLVGSNEGSISGTNTVIGTINSTANRVGGLVGLTKSNGKLTGTNYYHSNKDSGGLGIRVYSADADGVTVSGGEPIQIGEKNFYEAGTELTLTGGLAVKGANNGTYTVTDHDLADDIYYAIIPPAGYEYLSGNEYNGYYCGEVVFKPKAGYLGENITRTISEPNQTLESGTLTLDTDNRYVFKNVDETYSLATAQNVAENNYPDLTQVYKVTVLDDMTVQGSASYTVDGTIYYKSGSTITVAGNEYTVYNDMTFSKEVEAASWTFVDNVASYKSATTTISYTLDDNEKSANVRWHKFIFIWRGFIQSQR